MYDRKVVNLISNILVQMKMMIAFMSLDWLVVNEKLHVFRVELELSFTFLVSD